MENTINVFTDGLTTDMHPLTTQETQLTDALNATMITYDGNEMLMQNDMGNARISDNEGGTVALSKGFIPIGVKEHGGVLYIASVNGEGKGEIGSIPSPLLMMEKITKTSANTLILPFIQPIQPGDIPPEEIDNTLIEDNAYWYNNYLLGTVKLSDTIIKLGDVYGVVLTINDEYGDPSDTSYNGYPMISTITKSGKCNYDGVFNFKPKSKIENGDLIDLAVEGVKSISTDKWYWFYNSVDPEGSENYYETDSPIEIGEKVDQFNNYQKYPNVPRGQLYADLSLNLPKNIVICTKGSENYLIDSTYNDGVYTAILDCIGQDIYAGALRIDKVKLISATNYLGEQLADDQTPPFFEVSYNRFDPTKVDRIEYDLPVINVPAGDILSDTRREIPSEEVVLPIAQENNQTQKEYFGAKAHQAIKLEILDSWKDLTLDIKVMCYHYVNGDPQREMPLGIVKFKYNPTRTIDPKGVLTTQEMYTQMYDAFNPNDNLYDELTDNVQLRDEFSVTALEKNLFVHNAIMDDNAGSDKVTWFAPGCVYIDSSEKTSLLSYSNWDSYIQQGMLFSQCIDPSDEGHFLIQNLWNIFKPSVPVGMSDLEVFISTMDENNQRINDSNRIFEYILANLDTNHEASRNLTVADLLKKYEISKNNWDDSSIIINWDTTINNNTLIIDRFVNSLLFYSADISGCVGNSQFLSNIQFRSLFPIPKQTENLNFINRSVNGDYVHSINNYSIYTTKWDKNLHDGASYTEGSDKITGIRFNILKDSSNLKRINSTNYLFNDGYINISQQYNPFGFQYGESIYIINVDTQKRVEHSASKNIVGFHNNLVFTDDIIKDSTNIEQRNSFYNRLKNCGFEKLSMDIPIDSNLQKSLWYEAAAIGSNNQYGINIFGIFTLPYFEILFSKVPANPYSQYRIPVQIVNSGPEGLLSIKGEIPTVNYEVGWESINGNVYEHTSTFPIEYYTDVTFQGLGKRPDTAAYWVNINGYSTEDFIINVNGQDLPSSPGYFTSDRLFLVQFNADDVIKIRVASHQSETGELIYDGYIRNVGIYLRKEGEDFTHLPVFEEAICYEEKNGQGPIGSSILCGTKKYNITHQPDSPRILLRSKYRHVMPNRAQGIKAWTLDGNTGNWIDDGTLATKIKNLLPEYQQ